MSDIEINNLYESIAVIIENARKNVRRSVNNSMVACYWNIGKLIVENEQFGEKRAAYGKDRLKNISIRLTANFGKGYTVNNLRYMRQFYSAFPKYHAVSDELSWTHYRSLLKVEDEKARRWYMEEAIKENWSTRALERQINSFLRPSTSCIYPPRKSCNGNWTGNWLC